MELLYLPPHHVVTDSNKAGVGQLRNYGLIYGIVGRVAQSL